MRLLRYVDAALVIGLSTASIVIATCDYFDLFQNISIFAKPDYSALLIVLISCIGLHLAFVHVERLHFYESLKGGSEHILQGFRLSTDELLRGVRGASVRVFKDSVEQELYLGERIRDAGVEVCDLSWKDRISRESALPRRIRSHKTYESAIGKAAARIPYREIFVFSDKRRKEKLKRRIDEGIAGYSCRYFPDPGVVPRLQFVIIDKQEIVLMASDYPCLCAIRQAELAQIFQAYFESIWNAATPLKEATKLYDEELKRVLSASEIFLPNV
jgi:hypothetical protein